MIILVKLELTLLMIVTAHVLVVLRLWFTFIVLEEEERCKYEFARQDAPLRPPIPGAF